MSNQNCQNCLQVDGHSLDCGENVDMFIAQINAKLRKSWGRPLHPSGVKFFLERARSRVKCESARAEIDARLGRLGESSDNHHNEELKSAWRKRNAKARGYGVMTQQELEKVWKKREEKMREMERQ